MPSELEQTYPVTLCGGDFYKRGFLRPSAVLNLAQRVADAHLARNGADISVLAPHHLSWVFVLIALRISLIPDGCVSLGARTWFSEQKGPYFRREMEFFSPEGERLIAFSSYSVLIDLVSRGILRPSALPIALNPPCPVFTIPDISPKLPLPATPLFCYDDVIRNCHIDLLGHVNNSHYADFAFNCLTGEEMAHRISEMDINFLSELHPRTRFRLFREEEKADSLFMKGQETESGKTSFAARIKLEEK